MRYGANGEVEIRKVEISKGEIEKRKHDLSNRFFQASNVSILYNSSYLHPTRKHLEPLCNELNDHYQKATILDRKINSGECDKETLDEMEFEISKIEEGKRRL